MEEKVRCSVCHEVIVADERDEHVVLHTSTAEVCDVYCSQTHYVGDYCPGCGVGGGRPTFEKVD